MESSISTGDRLTLHFDLGSNANWSLYLEQTLVLSNQPFFAASCEGFDFIQLLGSTEANVYYDNFSILLHEPNDFDLDGDGLTREEELALHLNPDALDSDDDGIDDGAETNTIPSLADSDGDGLPDGWELTYGLDPLDPADAANDADSDGLSNSEEFFAGTNPTLSDSDSDLMPDAWELQYYLDPTDAADAALDFDADGLTNLQEYNAGTNPQLADSDRDGLVRWARDQYFAHQSIKQ